jgi:hypothetical protein
MTALLEKAFAKASHLPRAAQEQLAEQLLEISTLNQNGTKPSPLPSPCWKN